MVAGATIAGFLVGLFSGGALCLVLDATFRLSPDEPPFGWAPRAYVSALVGAVVVGAAACVLAIRASRTRPHAGPSPDASHGGPVTPTHRAGWVRSSPRAMSKLSVAGITIMIFSIAPLALFGLADALGWSGSTNPCGLIGLAAFGTPVGSSLWMLGRCLSPRRPDGDA